jgi:AraC-like DNA-binding protein
MVQQQSKQPSIPVQRFSTDALPEKQRLPYWREFFGRTVVRTDIDALSPAPFYSRAAFANLADVRFVYADTQAHVSRRTRTLMADGTDDVLLKIMVGGCAVGTQCGRSSQAETGDAFLMMNQEPGSVAFPGAARYVNVSVPMDRLKAVIPDAEARVAQRIPRDAPALRLFKNYLKNYVGSWEKGELTATPELSQTLVNHVYDLFTLVAGVKGDNAQQAVQRGARTARLAEIREEISKRALEPGFTLPALAQRIGVTPRYVQIVLREADSSFVKEITRQRLQQTLRLLRSPAHRGMSIAEVAFRCGFSTVEHFHRTFRGHYGVTPGDIRAGLMPSQPSF